MSGNEKSFTDELIDYLLTTNIPETVREYAVDFHDKHRAAYALRAGVVLAFSSSIENTHPFVAKTFGRVLLSHVDWDRVYAALFAAGDESPSQKQKTELE